MNKKYLVLAMVVLAGGIWLFTAISEQGTTSEGLHYQGVACIKVTRANGQVENIGCYKNLITNLGKRFLQGNVNGTWTGNAQVQLTKLALGYNTTAQVATDTTLDGIYTTCGLSNATGTIQNLGDGNTSIYYTWTATSACSVNATGILNASAASSAINYLFAETTFANTALNNLDTITINYTYWWA